jgi:hypothetical protein
LNKLLSWAVVFVVAGFAIGGVFVTLRERAETKRRQVEKFCQVWDQTEGIVATVWESGDDYDMGLETMRQALLWREEVAPKELKADLRFGRTLMDLPAEEQKRPSQQKRLKESGARIREYVKEECGF